MIRAAVLLLAFTAFSVPAAAEVRLGKNVRIGGHDASNQTFTKEKRGEYNIYTEEPKNAGCAWKKNKDGSKTKVCNLKKKGNESR